MNDAFGTRQSSGTWCRIGNGKIIRKAEATTPGAVKVPKKDDKGNAVLDKNGQPEYKYELHSDNVTGYITGIRTDESDYGRNLVLTLQHSQAGTINVSLPEGKRYWGWLVRMLPNVDLTKPVTISPWDYIKRSDGKRTIGLAVNQGEEDLRWAFTAEETPKANVVKINNQEHLDFGPVINFLIEKSLVPFQAKLAATPKPEIPKAELRQPEDQAAVYGAGNVLDAAAATAARTAAPAAQAPQEHIPDGDDGDLLPF